MIWVAGVIIAGIAIVILMRRPPKRYRNARIRTKGTSPVQMCSHPRCGSPRGKCRRDTRRAEHAEGMLGPRKD